MTVDSFSRIMQSVTLHALLSIGLRNMSKQIQDVSLISKFPRPQCAGISPALWLHLQDLQELLQMSWCQILQGTFRGLVETVPQKVGTVFGCIWQKHILDRAVWMTWHDPGNMACFSIVKVSVAVTLQVTVQLRSWCISEFGYVHITRLK